ncbi:MAG: hypothetical protein WC812_03460 [Candidatus Pacearchaeota archaeon]|jgi:hypothetical protein
MKKTYLKCQTKEAEFEDECLVMIPLSNGKVHSGVIEKKFFNKKGYLEIVLIEDHGEKALIMLPQDLNRKTTIVVDSKNIII